LLGRLFSNNSDQLQKTEIVLLITPHIIRNIVRPELADSEFFGGTESVASDQALQLRSTPPVPSRPGLRPTARPGLRPAAVPGQLPAVPAIPAEPSGPVEPEAEPKPVPGQLPAAPAIPAEPAGPVELDPEPDPVPVPGQAEPPGTAPEQ